MNFQMDTCPPNLCILIRRTVLLEYASMQSLRARIKTFLLFAGLGGPSLLKKRLNLTVIGIFMYNRPNPACYVKPT